MIECIDFKIYSLKYISVKAHYGASQCSLSGNIFLKPRPVIQFGPCVILLSRGSSYRYVRINTSSRRRKDTHLRVILQQNRRGAVALLHFSPSKMSTTVDPQRTAQIREVLAQTLSPDAATRRTVSFCRPQHIYRFDFRHHSDNPAHPITYLPDTRCTPIHQSVRSFPHPISPVHVSLLQ